MDPVNSIIEIAGPLLLGLVCGALFRKVVYPRILEQLGGLARLAASSANTWSQVALICVTLGLAAACHASNAVATLMWLHEHLPTLPFPLTQGLLHWVFLAATFFTGYYLAMLPSASEEPSGTV
ncbi:hypothetical protein [Corallococcus carmarthensis]|uniref:hypothetical protein n=1 Tax=Corallococcus carmarthensis TaxID=2316728 RepID=UPI00148E5CCF|nr:hypothetical protein [Corallococcus carmarthensis]NOK21152.1 hypothetical protein [Corallococcus carmarthensis]